jgi:Na+/pantothenate symporter
MFGMLLVPSGITLETFKVLQVLLDLLVLQEQLAQQAHKVNLEILQLHQQRLHQVQMQVMLGLILIMEKLMFITIATGLKLEQRL